MPNTYAVSRCEGISLASAATMGDWFPLAHTRCKQIDIRFHHLRNLVSQHHLRLAYLPTHQMVADGLTKPLAPGRMNGFLKLFGIVEPSN